MTGRRDSSSHAKTTEDNQDGIEGEDVGDSKGKAENNAQYTGPRKLVRPIPVYATRMLGAGCLRSVAGSIKQQPNELALIIPCDHAQAGRKDG